MIGLKPELVCGVEHLFENPQCLVGIVFRNDEWREPADDGGSGGDGEEAGFHKLEDEEEGGGFSALGEAFDLFDGFRVELETDH